MRISSVIYKRSGKQGAGSGAGAAGGKDHRAGRTERRRQVLPDQSVISRNTDGTYIMDTPGFTSLELPQITKEELGGYYPEFRAYEPLCKFRGCAHISEPECSVKEAVEAGKISQVRYENYMVLYREVKENKRY